MEKHTAIDLFCGAGGLTCGLKQAEFKVIAAVEWHDIAAETYRANHPSTQLWQADICDLSPHEAMKALGIAPHELSLLAACPPCQGFSALRTRNKTLSVEDRRNDLIFEFLRWVKVFLPKCVVLENVPALAYDQRMQQAIGQLRTLGYLVDDHSLLIHDIANYGVPQRRSRMMLIASRYGVIDLPKTVGKKTTVWQAIGHLPKAGFSGDVLHDLPEERSAKIKTLISLIPKDGGSRLDLPQAYWLDCHKRYPNGFKDVYGRMRWNEVAPTITGGCHNPSKGRFLHPEENRAITLREAALLQSFPEDYYFSLRRGKCSAALMIGNALPPKFMKQQGLAIANHLDNTGFKMTTLLPTSLSDKNLRYLPPTPLPTKANIGAFARLKSTED
ncbi:DNA cytosine methyltransferase [Methylosoma difficile]